MAKLMMHKGAVEISAADLRHVRTPDATRTWQPMGHHEFVEIVEREMAMAGMQIVTRNFGIWKEGARFFGILQLAPEGAESDFAAVVGLRNSHDMSFAAGLCMGSSVFVCDNLAFNSDVVLHRAHTRNIFRDMPGLVSKGVARLVAARQVLGERIGTYKVVPVDDAGAHDFLVRAVDRHVLPVTALPGALAEWRNPSHEDFQPRTVWSLFNAVTEVIKGTNLEALPRRTEALHGLADQFAGLVKR